MFVECHQLSLCHGRTSTLPELLGRREPSRHNKLCAPTTEREIPLTGRIEEIAEASASAATATTSRSGNRRSLYLLFVLMLAFVPTYEQSKDQEFLDELCACILWILDYCARCHHGACHRKKVNYDLSLILRVADALFATSLFFGSAFSSRWRWCSLQSLRASLLYLVKVSFFCAHLQREYLFWSNIIFIAILLDY